MKSVKQFLFEELVSARDRMRSCIYLYDNTIIAERAGGRPQFKVTIKSLWEKEGEQNIEAEAISLGKAIAEAIKKFKDVNRRSDVQGQFSVFAVFGSGIEIVLPEKYWKKYTTTK